MACASNLSRPREIYFFVSARPWGPFEELSDAVTVPDPEGKISLVYCAFLHPEMFREEGRVVSLTYCYRQEEKFGNPGYTNPEMLEVELTR